MGGKQRFTRLHSRPPPIRPRPACPPAGTRHRLCHRAGQRQRARQRHRHFHAVGGSCPQVPARGGCAANRGSLPAPVGRTTVGPARSTCAQPSPLLPALRLLRLPLPARACPADRRRHGGHQRAHPRAAAVLQLHGLAGQLCRRARPCRAHPGHIRGPRSLRRTLFPNRILDKCPGTCLSRTRAHPTSRHFAPHSPSPAQATCTCMAGQASSSSRSPRPSRPSGRSPLLAGPWAAACRAWTAWAPEQGHQSRLSTAYRSLASWNVLHVYVQGVSGLATFSE